ncbi:hypothetical protein GGTG_11696 [Gaeumannomyces tritici R3-111a-1]|uniref:Uncharacterized protein n=1 Tax=Gaeumannomyces tritici (strain R3-111a-1) TaxID=644352 RepID=J3PDX3_GAET3|nr:hypothetical protein GGTG_11696 [Gaeumannomyces tritici R3-111a-1]EJT70673.1 hypothetical protein GGTG_11696 [Gaeumannomyces tritici R3-111a-1]
MSQPPHNDLEEGEPVHWRWTSPWLLEILRRERHRPRADRNDEHLGAMFDAASTGDFNRLKVALVTLTQSREQIDASMLHEHGGWDRHVTPLHAAASGGHLDAATLLIALGADLEASVGQAGDRFTPPLLPIMRLEQRSER